jgi:hypothetical protein
MKFLDLVESLVTREPLPLSRRSQSAGINLE